MTGFSTHERYVNFYTDFAFKKLFGTEANKELLISFLNAMFDGRENIKDITYLPTEHLPDTARDRRAVFDVYCESADGDKFLIEMQKANQEYFKDRSVYYSTFPIREQAKRGDWDYQLSRVYAIGILNFTFDNDEDFMSTVKLCDTVTNEVFYDKLTFIYLEMPKFRKTETELTTIFDKWLFAIKNLDKLYDKPVALQEKVFMRLFEQAEIAKFTPLELSAYEDSLKVYRDWYSVMKTQKKEGFVEGKAEGLAEGEKIGIEKGKAEGEKIGIEKGEKIGIEKGEKIGIEKGEKIGIEKGEKLKAIGMAKTMKADGVPVDTISKYTGLTISEIEAL
jgi:predicted transposase/invertase (TIGR01784 family)